MTFYYVLYFTMYFGPVAFMYKINNFEFEFCLDNFICKFLIFTGVCFTVYCLYG